MRIRLAIIALSVSANVVLGVAWRQRRDAPAAGTPASAIAASEPAPTAPVPDGRSWEHLTGDGDDAAFVARLREAGFPPRLVRLLVHQRVRERFAPQFRALAKADIAETPYWRKRSWQWSSASSAELRAQRRELEQQVADLTRALLGPEASLLPGDFQLAERQRRYGSIPADKVDLLQSIARDYRDLSAQIRATARGIPLAEDREQLAYLEREQRADIERLLTLEELDEFDRRSSPAARRVQNQLRFFDSTEDEYLALYRLQHDFDRRYGRDHLTGEQEDRRRAALPELRQQIAAALGPERFAEYAITTDGNFRGTRLFVTGIGLPVDTAKSLVALQQDIKSRAEAVRADLASTPEARAARLAALQADATEKLVATIGAEHIESYRRGPGGWVDRLARQNRSDQP